jgi:hypothetical protein
MSVELLDVDELAELVAAIGDVGALAVVLGAGGVVAVVGSTGAE